MIARVLNIQGIAGLIVSAGLAVLLLLAKGDARHFRKQAGQFEQLYRAEQLAFATMVAAARSAADEARKDDAANGVRVRAQQSAINQRSVNDYEARLEAARAAASRLSASRYSSGRMLAESPAAPAHPGAGGATHLPSLSDTACCTGQAAGQGGLSRSDALTATEQAIQLDELIKWVRAQAKVDPIGSQNELTDGGER
ncbi:MAG: hypothetical protein ABIW33_08875 [Sphingomicrobium sp.]